VLPCTNRGAASSVAYRTRLLDRRGHQHLLFTAVADGREPRSRRTAGPARVAGLASTRKRTRSGGVCATGSRMTRRPLSAPGYRWVQETDVSDDRIRSLGSCCSRAFRTSLSLPAERCHCHVAGRHRFAQAIRESASSRVAGTPEPPADVEVRRIGGSTAWLALIQEFDREIETDLPTRANPSLS
jgi:hypothetical protein